MPKAFEPAVPEVPRSYLIYRPGQSAVAEAILDIGQDGPRPNPSPIVFRARLASSFAHSASERITQDVFGGVLAGGAFGEDNRARIDSPSSSCRRHGHKETGKTSPSAATN